MWQWVKVFLKGTSHVKSSMPCQDYCEASFVTGTGEDCLLVAISDGAGSASHSEKGSQFVVNNVLEILISKIKAQDIDETEAKNLIAEVRENLIEYAKSLNLEVKDLACTLLVACVRNSQSFFIHIGDGCWVIKTELGLSCPTWPFTGEFANETKFITSPDFENFIQYKSINEKINFVAGFTDGIQSLVLNFSSKEPHAGFFNPFFDSLSKAENLDDFEKQLREFLDSEGVNQRTDDDKTLFLGLRQ